MRFCEQNSIQMPNHLILQNFKASLFDIYINESETVTFTVEAISDTSLPESIDLLEESRVIASMLDNGQNGDLVASDGIYSVTIDLLKGDVALVNYYAAYGNAKSNTFEICYYRDITQDEFISYSKLLSQLNQMTFEEAKQFVKSSDEILSYDIDEENRVITFKSIYGISGIWEEQDPSTKGNQVDTTAEGTFRKFNSNNSKAEYDQIKAAFSSPIQSNLNNSNVVVLRTFRSSEFKYDDFLYAGETLSDGLGGTLTVIDDEDVTLSVMKSMSDYGIVLIDSYGGLSDFYKKTFIVTGESFDEMKFLLDPVYYITHVGYSADYLADRIFGTSKNRAAVGSGFFEKYYSDNSLHDAFWYLGCCYSFYDSTLSHSLINKGAGAVVGFTNPVSIRYCNELLYECVAKELLLSGSSLSDAIASAKRIYGNTDPYESNYVTEAQFTTKDQAQYYLVARGTLAGKICKASDRTAAIPDASIAVYKNNALYTSSTSNQTGDYVMNLPAGRYYITITAPGYITFSAYATVRKDQTTYMETFLLVEGSEEDTGTASGMITNSLTGKGVADVNLTIRKDWNNTDETASVVGTAVSDANGNYSIELPFGNYTVVVSKDGFTSSTFNIVVQAGVTGNQNGVITPIISDETYLITLTWGENPRDLDSHVEGTLSNGNHFHVYFSHKNQYDGDTEVCALDYDDTNSYGPEHITLNPTCETPYYYYIYRYAGSGTIASSGAKITIQQGNTLIAEFNVPTDLGSGRYWNVFAVKNGQLIIKNTITSSADIDYAK